MQLQNRLQLQYFCWRWALLKVVQCTFAASKVIDIWHLPTLAWPWKWIKVRDIWRYDLTSSSEEDLRIHVKIERRSFVLPPILKRSVPLIRLLNMNLHNLFTIWKIRILLLLQWRLSDAATKEAMQLSPAFMKCRIMRRKWAWMGGAIFGSCWGARSWMTFIAPLAYSSTFDVILILFKERALDKHSFKLNPFGRIVQWYREKLKKKKLERYGRYGDMERKYIAVMWNEKEHILSCLCLLDQDLGLLFDGVLQHMVFWTTSSTCTAHRKLLICTGLQAMFMTKWFSFVLYGLGLWSLFHSHHIKVLQFQVETTFCLFWNACKSCLPFYFPLKLYHWLPAFSNQNCIKILSRK